MNYQIMEKLAKGSQRTDYGSNCYHHAQVKRAQRSYKRKIAYQLQQIVKGQQSADELDLSPIAYGWTD